MRAAAQAKPTAMPAALTPARSDLMQRKCACRGAPPLQGECAECRAKRLQGRTANQGEASTVSPTLHEELRSPAQPLDLTTHTLKESRFGHDFGKARVHADAPQENHPIKRAANSRDAIVTSNLEGQELPARGSGRPLDGAARTAIEASFGRTFSDVRLHSGPEVDNAAEGLRASAFTVGSDIYLHSKGPDLATTAGRTVLGEEVAHVAQGIGTASLERVTSPSEPLEQEAREAGLAASAGQPVSISPSAEASSALARQEGVPAEEMGPSLELLSQLRFHIQNLKSVMGMLHEKPPNLVGAWLEMFDRSPGFTLGSYFRRRFPPEFASRFEDAGRSAQKDWEILDAIARPRERGGPQIGSNFASAVQALTSIVEETTVDIITGGIGGIPPAVPPESSPELPRRRPHEPPLP